MLEDALDEASLRRVKLKQWQRKKQQKANLNALLAPKFLQLAEKTKASKAPKRKPVGVGVSVGRAEDEVVLGELKSTEVVGRETVSSGGGYEAETVPATPLSGLRLILNVDDEVCEEMSCHGEKVFL